MPYILTIRERGHSWAGRSPVSRVHETSAEARSDLLEYVRRNWESEMGTDQPDDPDELIQEYFDEVLGAYSITEQGAIEQRR